MSMKLCRACLPIAAFALLACGAHSTAGVNLATMPPSVAKTEPPPQTPPTDETSKKPDQNRARAWASAVIGCFIGGPYSEALGAIGDERTLADLKRCRAVSTGPLGAKEDDEKALAAVRAIDAPTVQRIVEAIKAVSADMGAAQKPLLDLVSATADAAREAMMARRAAEALRVDSSAKDTAKETAETKDKTSTFVEKKGLAALWQLDTPESRVVALILAADHVEAVRGLSPRAKILAASPAFDVVFGVALPAGATDAKPGDWLAYLGAAAKAAGHAPKLEANAPTNEQEQAAFAGVAAGFADRFEAAAAKVSGGELKDVATGYAKRLRAELAEAEAKAKAKAQAKKTTEDAAKKQKK